MRQVSRAQRLQTAATWPVGIVLTSWDYLWRTTPMHRLELSGRPSAEERPPGSGSAEGEDAQPAGAGVGPLYHRRYATRIRDTAMTPEELMRRLTRDINEAAPTSFARFVRTRGEPGGLRVGDEFVVRMPGPWDGPVRVVAVDATSFRLATLAGHLEAGQIEFAASRGRYLEFSIEAWARSGDRLSNLLYQHLRMAKEVQLHMWVSFLEGVTRLAGGRMTGGIDVLTWRIEDPLPAAGKLRAALESLPARDFNFDPDAAEPRTGDAGWRLDDFCQALPAEPPGPPVAGGSFEIATELLHGYLFADPGVVRAHYDPAEPREHRNMLLEIHFRGLRFLVGVRVLELYDRLEEREGRQVRIAGWSYGTLEGHFEAGKLDWQVWKWLDTGEVEFRTHAYSRRAPVSLITRAGFGIFGRREQLSFMHGTRRRMAALTALRLAEAPGS
jgi:uncharacterized protein (UPF0548 family)